MTQADLTQSTATGPGIAPGAQRPGLILAFLCIAQFMVFLDVSIVNVALPSIERGLRISEANLPYVVTLYGTALGGFLLLGSRLADTFGRRRMLRAGLALFGAASLASGLAHQQAMLFAARGAQGLGSALIAPAALSILTTTFTGGPERARALGVWGALTGLASVVGVVLGGVLSGGPGWRWIFFINVPVAALALATAARVLPESRGPGRRFDIAGALALTVGLLALIYGLDDAISRGWGSAPVIAGLITTSQEAGGALGVAVAATFAFRRVATLTAAAHGSPHLIQAARTTVFHDGFAAAAVFAVVALLISVILLPPIPSAGRPSQQ